MGPAVDLGRCGLEVRDQDRPCGPCGVEVTRGFGLRERAGKAWENFADRSGQLFVKFHAVGLFLHQCRHRAFVIRLLCECGLGIGDQLFALDRILGIGGRGKQGFAVFFENVGSLERLFGGGDRLGHFHHDRAEVHAGGLEVVDRFTKLLQRLGMRLAGGGECGIELGH